MSKIDLISLEDEENLKSYLKLYPQDVSVPIEVVIKDVLTLYNVAKNYKLSEEDDLHGSCLEKLSSLNASQEEMIAFTNSRMELDRMLSKNSQSENAPLLRDFVSWFLFESHHYISLSKIGIIARKKNLK